VVLLFSSPEELTELLQQDSELSITLREKDTSRVLSEISFMTPVEEPHSQRSSSETHTDTSKELSTSSPSKVCTLDSSSMPVPRHPSQLVTFSQFPPCQKELLSPTAKVKWEIEDHSPEPQEPQPLSSVTPMMARSQESDSHQEPERPSSDHAELWLVWLPVDKEPISHFLRLPTPGSRPRERETTGQELEVLQ